MRLYPAGAVEALPPVRKWYLPGMFTVRRSVRIARPPAEVFAYLAAFDHDREWRSEVTAVRRLGGPHEAAGERYEELMSFPGLRIRGDFTVAAFEPPRLLMAEGCSDEMTASQRYEIAPDEAGTLLDVTTCIEAKGFLRLGEPIAVRLLGGRAEANLRRLKRLLEQGGEGTPAR